MGDPSLPVKVAVAALVEMEAQRFMQTPHKVERISLRMDLNAYCLISRKVTGNLGLLRLFPAVLGWRVRLVLMTLEVFQFPVSNIHKVQNMELMVQVPIWDMGMALWVQVFQHPSWQLVLL